MNNAEQVWNLYNQSNQNQNDDWKNLLHDDITFTGPVMAVSGKEEYIKTTVEFMGMIRGYELKRFVSSDSLLVTEVEVQIATPSDTVITLDMSEFYEVTDSKIKSVKVHYDATQFRKEFGIPS